MVWRKRSQFWSQTSTILLCIPSWMWPVSWRSLKLIYPIQLELDWLLFRLETRCKVVLLNCAGSSNARALRNKPNFILNLRSYRNIWRSVHSTNTTGTHSSLNFRSSTTLFVPGVILFKAIPVLEVIKAHLSVKRPSTGFIQTTLFPLSWPFYEISQYWVTLEDVAISLPRLNLWF